MSALRNLVRQDSPRSIPAIASRASRCPAAVRLSLLVLRVYLLALVALMIYKFVLIVTQG